jgi:hypothetical protein
MRKGHCQAGLQAGQPGQQIQQRRPAGSSSNSPGRRKRSEMVKQAGALSLGQAPGQVPGDEHRRAATRRSRPAAAPPLLTCFQVCGQADAAAAPPRLRLAAGPSPCRARLACRPVPRPGDAAGKRVHHETAHVPRASRGTRRSGRQFWAASPVSPLAGPGSSPTRHCGHCQSRVSATGPSVLDLRCRTRLPVARPSKPAFPGSGRGGRAADSLLVVASRAGQGDPSSSTLSDSAQALLQRAGLGTSGQCKALARMHEIPGHCDHGSRRPGYPFRRPFLGSIDART